MKLLLTLALAFTCHLCTGQIVKGTWSLGPDLDYSFSKIEIDEFNSERKSSDLTLGATAGYYVIDNLQIGISIGMFSNKDDSNGFESSQTGFYIGPGVEYKIPLSSQFYLPLGAGLLYESATAEDDNENDFKLSGISFHLLSGIEFVVNNKLGAFVHIGPSFGSLKEEESEFEFDATTFGADVGFRVYF